MSLQEQCARIKAVLCVSHTACHTLVQHKNRAKLSSVESLVLRKETAMRRAWVKTTLYKRDLKQKIIPSRRHSVLINNVKMDKSQLIFSGKVKEREKGNNDRRDREEK